MNSGRVQGVKPGEVLGVKAGREQGVKSRRVQSVTPEVPGVKVGEDEPGWEGSQGW